MNKTFIDLINEIAIAINGKNASTNSRPTKAEIQVTINDAQHNICNGEEEYTFLRKVGTAHGYTLDTTLTTTLPDNSDISSAQGNLATSGHIYIASPCTVTNVSTPFLIVAEIAKVATGFGEFYGNMQVHICPIINGKPDTSNPVISSNLFNPYRPATTLTAEPFYFTASDVVPKGSYYIVLDITPNVYNGVPLKWGTNTGDTTGWIKQTTGDWVACEGILFDVYEYLGVYTSTVTLPTDARWVNRLYSGDVNLLAFPYDVYQRKGGNINTSDIPQNIFILNGNNSNGDLTAIIKSNTANVLDWTVEYMAIPVKLVNDTDYPLIPKAHRNVLKWKALLDLTAQNNGIALDKNIILANYTDELNKLKSACLPYEQQSLSVNCGGFVNNQEELELDDPNTWREARNG